MDTENDNDKTKRLADLEKNVETQYGTVFMDFLKLKFQAFDEQATENFNGFKKTTEGRFQSVENATASNFKTLNETAQQEVRTITKNLEQEAKKVRLNFIRICGGITVVLVGTLALSLLASYREINQRVIDLQGTIIAAQPLVTKAEESLNEEKTRLVNTDWSGPHF